MTDFTGFGLPQALADSLARMQYSTPTPIQAQAIPLALAGRDVLGSAQTGTGKTAAFGIPLITRLLTQSRGSALVLLPTLFATHWRHRLRSSAVLTVAPAPSSACWVTRPLFSVQVPLRVCVDSFAGGGAEIRSHAVSAFFWFLLFVAALETWVTVTMPPNATSVATTATIRRRPLNHPVLLFARRYWDLRMGDTFLLRDQDAIGATAPGRCAWS